MLRLDNIETPRRTPRSFTLLPNTIDLVERLAGAYGTNASRIVEAMIVQYGPKLLDERGKEAAKA